MRIEIRSDSVILDGYVNVTARESRVLPSPTGQFVEEIVPKTFDRALAKGHNIDLLFNHDQNHRLGSTKQGNLSLREDNIGLRASAEITCPIVMEKAKKNELRGWSFGFQAIRTSWKTKVDGMPKRFVEEMDLAEVSILDRTPAYVGTSVEMRGNEAVMTEMRAYDDDAEIVISSEIKKEDETKTNTNENRHTPESFYFANLENELTLLQIGGFR